MKIADVICVPGRAGFFFDDQAAVRAGAAHDGFDYLGQPLTPGFTRIRQPGESVGVMIVLEDGDVAYGDCVAVQYSGAGGRDPLFEAASVIQTIEREVTPLLLGASLEYFRPLAEQIDGIISDGVQLHTALRYGVTQALLDAVARSRRLTMAEVISQEYQVGVEIKAVPMFVQSGDERYENVEKMILKEVEILPHGLINHVGTKVGDRGELLVEYVRWVRDRVLALRTRDSYVPTLHFDTYGTLGEVFALDISSIADYLLELSKAATPFRLRIEHPLDAGSRARQIAALGALRSELHEREIQVEIVVDEWCNTLEDIRAFVASRAADVIHVKMPDLGGINNTIEALLHVRDNGLLAYCGGSCNETERSAQISAQVAMACGADQVLAKPGMGVDEGLMIVGNEMARVEALVRARQRDSHVREALTS